MQNCKLFFTIHNLDSQGECRQDEFSATGKLLAVDIHTRSIEACQSGRGWKNKLGYHDRFASYGQLDYSDFSILHLDFITQKGTASNMGRSGNYRYWTPKDAGVSGQDFAHVDRALDERTIGHNPERLCLMKVDISLISMTPTVYHQKLVSGLIRALWMTEHKPLFWFWASRACYVQPSCLHYSCWVVLSDPHCLLSSQQKSSKMSWGMCREALCIPMQWQQFLRRTQMRPLEGAQLDGSNPHLSDLMLERSFQ